MTSPASVVNEAVNLVFYAKSNTLEPTDFQRFLDAVTGDSLVGDRYTEDQMIAWAQSIITAVETAAAKPPDNTGATICTLPTTAA
jgi:hypothetical protein